MKHLFLALLVALCLSPDPAEAGIVASAIGAFLATTGAGAGVFGGLSAAFGVLTSTFVGRLIVGAALSLAGQLLQKKPKAVVPGIQTEQTTTGDVTPQKIVVGTYALEGHAVAPAYSRGPDNRILTYILEVSNKPVEGLTGRVIVDGQYATIEAPDAGRRDRQVLTELRQDDNDPTAWMWFYDGTQTTAAQTLVDDYGSHPDRPWGATFIGEGTAYAIMEFFLDREFYSGLPAVRFEVKGIRLYDPRKDTTVGGSGAHRWGDESTYEWTDNPQVINYNILRGITLPTGDIYGGQVPAEDLPLDNWFAAMNECDVLIGSRKQFTAGFEINVGEMEPFEVIQEMNRASFAQMSEFGGVFRVRVGAPASAVLSVSDDDFVITEPSQYIPFPGLAETHNAITGTYVEPVDVWQARSADAVTKPDWETEDGGRRLTLNIDLPAVSVKSQAQHLLNAYLEDNRRFRVHRMGLPPSFAEIEPLDVISFTSEINGYTSKAFEVIEVESRSDTLLQIVTVREREAGDVAWTSGDDVPAPGPSNGLTKPSDFVPTLTLTGVTIDDDSSDDVLPAIKIEWAETGFSPTDSIKWEVRKTTGATIVASGITGADSGETVVAGIAGNTSYEVRARYVVGVPTAWSAWSAVTTPNVSFGGTAGTDGKSTYQAAIFKRAATAPAAPTGGSFDFGTEVLTTPAGWSESVPADDGNPVWITRFLFSVSGDTGSDTAGTWATPTKLSQDGASGADGVSTFLVPIYKRAASAPATPTGGQYDFGTETLTVPSGWSAEVPNVDGNPAWVSTALASVQGTTGVDSSLTWSAPKKLAQDGADGLNQATIDLFQKSTSGVTAPADPTSNLVYNFNTSSVDSFTAPNGWVVDAPSLAKGEFLWKISATASATTSTDLVGPSEWSDAVVVGIGGEDGSAGDPGADGARGAGRWHINVDAVVYSSATATGALPESSADAQEAWDQGTGSQPTSTVADDQAWFYNGTKSAPSAQGVWIYSGTSWDEQDEVVDGNLVVTETITARALRLVEFDNLIRNGTLRANDGTDAEGWQGYPTPGVSAKHTLAALGSGTGDASLSNDAPAEWYFYASGASDITTKISDSLEVDGGERFRLTAAYATNAAGSEIEFKMYFVTAGGDNVADVKLYQSSATLPGNPSGTFTYTFDTGALTGGTLNGWTQAVPTVGSGESLWVIESSAVDAGATASVSAASFSTPETIDEDDAKPNDEFEIIEGGVVGWSKRTAIFTAPAQAAFCTGFHIRHKSGETFVTNIRLQRMNAAQLMVDGGIETKMFKANAVTADIINTGVMSVDRLDVDGLLSIDDVTGGLGVGKISPFQNDVDGLYFGRTLEADGSTGFGFAASREAADGTLQSLELTKTNGLQLTNANFFKDQAQTPTVTIYTSGATPSFGAGVQRISIRGMGAGSGGNAGGNTPAAQGSAGGNTTVQLFDGVTLIETWVFNGGAAPATDGGGQSNIGQDGANSIFGAGGDGGSAGSPGGDATGSGAGGGGGGNTSGVGGYGGNAGETYIVVEYDITGLSSPSLVISPGVGGAGGTGSGGAANGGDGSGGQVDVAESSGDAPVVADVLPIEPTAVGSFASDFMGALTGQPIPAGHGSGFYILWTNSNATSMNLGFLTVDSSGGGFTNAVGEYVAFIASQTPVVRDAARAGTATTVSYKFYDMGL